MDYAGLKQEIEQGLFECGVEIRWVSEDSGHKYGYTIPLHGGRMEMAFVGVMAGGSIFDPSTPLRSATRFCIIPQMNE
jgi:hypothetical protein